MRQSVNRKAVIIMLACMTCGWACGAAAAAPPGKELIVWGTQALPELRVAFDKFEAEYPGWRIIASGGAGEPEHLREVFTDGKADAAIIASMIHYGTYTIPQIKDYLHENGVPVRAVPNAA